MYEKPNTLNYFIGSLCNSKCYYCYVNATFTLKNNLKSKFKLNIENIQDLRKIGISTINFTGGEPFIYEDIWELIEIFKSQGFAIRVSTNGINIIEKKESALLQKISQFNLSIDGIGEDHDMKRGIQGGFERNKELINYLNNKKIPYVVQAVLTSINYISLRKLIEFCYQHKAKKLKIVPVLQIGRGKMKNKFSESMIDELFDFVNDILEKIYYSVPIEIELNTREEYKNFLLINKAIPSIWYNAEINKVFLTNHCNNKYELELGLKKEEVNKVIDRWRKDYFSLVEILADELMYFNIYEEMDKFSLR